MRLIEGQVGQESNLQPAVLEHAARCPESSKNVQPLRYVQVIS